MNRWDVILARMLAELLPPPPQARNSAMGVSPRAGPIPKRPVVVRMGTPLCRRRRDLPVYRCAGPGRIPFLPGTPAFVPRRNKERAPCGALFFFTPSAARAAREGLSHKKTLTLVRVLTWAHTDSNRGPSACKADALNQLSYAPQWGVQIYKGFLIHQRLRAEIEAQNGR